MGIVGDAMRRTEKLDSIYGRIYEDVMAQLKIMPTDVIKWFRRNLDVNILNATPKSDSVSIVSFVEILQGRPLSDDEYFKAVLLEWCIKLLQAARLYAFSDTQPIHRQQCWYAGDDIVIKDSFWLDIVMHHLLKKYFRAETYYIQLLELFHDTSFQMEMGQLVHLITVSKNHVDLSRFSLQRHALITKSKACSFYLPVALAMYICGILESYTIRGCLYTPYAVARDILHHLAEYSQIQNDFLEYIGTDNKTWSNMMENKCSWCINVALVVASPEQRKVLEENYGRKDPVKEMRVRAVYETIGLREQYRMYEASLRERIEALIADIPEPEGKVDECVLKMDVFTRFFNEVYQRTK